MMNVELPGGETEFKQVRMRTLVETRHISVERCTTMIQLLGFSKDLFLPDGNSVIRLEELSTLLSLVCVTLT